MSTLMSQTRNRVPRFAEAAVERARLTVVPRRVHKAPKVPFVSLVSLLLVTGVVGLLLFNTHMQQGSFVATSMEERASVLDAEEQSLQMELDRLRDPQRVAARAKRLGMVPAASPAFLRLSDGKVLGNPAVATSEDSLRIVPLPTRKPKSLQPDPVIIEVKKPERVPKRVPKQVEETNRRDTGRDAAAEHRRDGRKNEHKPDRPQGSRR